MFNSVQHALSYAYRVHNTDIVKVSTILADLCSSGIKLPSSFGSMSPHDHHAEAATILRRVDALPVPQMHTVNGYYDRGIRWPSIEVLAEVIGYDNVGREPTRELIAAWFGEERNHYDEPISTRALSRRYGGSHMVYQRERARIFSQLSGLWRMAITRLEWEMLEKINTACASSVTVVA